MDNVTSFRLSEFFRINIAVPMLLALLLSLTGCGLAGAGAIAAATGGGSDSDNPVPLTPNDVPAVFVTTPGRFVGDVSIPFKLIDADEDNCSVTVTYGAGGADPTIPATPAAASDPVTGLSSSAAGTDHTFVWDSLTDLGPGYRTGIKIAIVASDGKDNSAQQSTSEFVIGNDAPVVEIQTPTGVQSGDIAFVYAAKDTSSDSSGLDVEFRLDNASAWTPALPITGLPVSGIITAPDPGVQHVFVWDSYDNTGGVGSEVSPLAQLRMRLNDAYENGAWVESNTFTINNNQPPMVQFTSIGDVAETHLVGVIPIRYRLLDDESNDCSVAVEGSLDGSTYFSLEEFPGGYRDRIFSQGSQNLSSSPLGDEHLFLWHPYANGIASSTGMYFRISVSDAFNAGNPAEIFTTKLLTYRQNGVPQPQNWLSDTSSPFSLATGDFNNDGIDDVLVGNKGWDNCSIFPGKYGVLPDDGEGLTVDAGGKPAALGVGDFNNDSISDFVIVREAMDAVWVYRGKNGTFPTADSPWIMQTGNESVSVTVGDFNDDGIDDFAVGAKMEFTVKLYLGVDGGVILNTSVIDLPVGNYARVIMTGDLNNDGIDDIIVTNTNDNNCTIYPGKAGAGPAAGDRLDLPTNDGPLGVCIGDFSGDGLNDFAISCTADNNLIVYAGLAGALPGAGDGVTLDIGDRAQSIGAGDFNGDGIKDIATTNIFTHTVTVYPGQAGGLPQNGQEHVVDITNLGIGQMIGDFNNDGLDDLLVIAGNLRFYPGMAGLFFTEADTVIILPNVGPYGRTFGDFNGDGVVDLAVNNGSLVAVFEGSEMTAPQPDERHIYRTGTWPYRGVVCDIDDNGVEDIITADVIGETLTVQLGRPGAFPIDLNAIALTTGYQPVFIRTGDFNFDQIDDIAAVQGLAGNRTAMLFAGKSGLPPQDGEATHIGVFDGTADLVVVDFNGDGIDDIVGGTSEAAGKSVIMYAGKSGQMPLDGEGVTLFDTVVNNTPRFEMAAGDFNCDGLNDLATANYYENTVTILIGQPGAFPMECQSVTLPLNVNPQYVVSGDLNGDGIDDLVFAHETSKDIIIYPGKDGTMPGAPDQWWLPIPAAGRPYGMDIGDFNADGIDDLVIVHHDALDNASIYFGALGSFPLMGFDVTMPAGKAPGDVKALDLNGDGVDDFVTADTLGQTNTVFTGRENRYSIPLSPTVLSYGEQPNQLCAVDTNGDGLKTFVSLDLFGGQCVIYKRFLCSPCLTFKVTPQASVRQWNNDYWKARFSLPDGAVTGDAVVYLMHADKLDLPRRPSANYHRSASAAVKLMPETLSFEAGKTAQITLPFLGGISQADIEDAVNNSRVRVFRFEREYDNGDGTFGRLLDISADISAESSSDRNVTFKTQRLGIFQLAIEYAP